MSKRFLKYETEVENGMVDENGVLVAGASGGAGGYKYFCVSVDSTGDTLYEMDGINNIPDESKITTKSEFEAAWVSGPIMLIPYDCLDKDNMFTGGDVPGPVVSYQIYAGKSTIRAYRGDGTLAAYTIKFAE